MSQPHPQRLYQSAPPNMSGKEEDCLSTKAEHLQTLLTRCSTLLHTSQLNHLPRQYEVNNNDNHHLKTRYLVSYLNFWE